MSIGYDDTGYEIYDAEKSKKKREFIIKPLNFNIKNLIILIIIFTILFLINDYCSNNFDIDLQEEYKNYKDEDLLFGKKNICQYARDKYIYDVLLFKYDYISISVYIILFIILIIILYYTGILETLGVYIVDNFSTLFDINKILYGSGLYKTFKKLFGCSDELFYSLFKAIF